MHCLFLGCTSDSRNKCQGLSFFNFPSFHCDPERCKQWIRFCHRRNLVPNKHAKICSNHFSAAQFSTNPSYMNFFGYKAFKPELKKNAVPDIGDIRIKRFGQDKGCSSTGATNLVTPPQVQPQHSDSKKRKFEDETLENHESVGQLLSRKSDINVPSFAENSDICTKGIQVNLVHTIKKQTRRIQVGLPQAHKVTADVGVQCDLATTCNCSANVESVASKTHESQESQEAAFESEYDPDDYSSASDLDSSEDESDDELQNYALEKTVDPTNEKYYVVSESSLHDAFSICRVCNAFSVPFIDHSRGSMISVTSNCLNGHVFHWKSQSTLNSLPLYNLVLASSILLSGNNTSKSLRLLHHSHLKTISTRTAERLQSLYTIPAIMEEYQTQQAAVLASLKEKPYVVLGGDGRCDTPGHSAKYCCYSLMDLDTNKIVDIQLIQSNEVKGSTHMELEGLKRCLALLETTGNINVKDLVTDRHVMVKSYMKKEKAMINHYFDVWHVAKGLSKKLETASKKRGGEQIRAWSKSIVNHCYYVASRSGNNTALKLALWNSIVNHIANIHTHDTAIFPTCEHESLENRDWMIEGSRCHKMTKEIILNSYLLRDIPKLSPVHQTYGLEVFHSVVNHFAPKNTHFFHSSMRARVYIAALHFNENGNRSQSRNKCGQLQWKKCYFRLC